MLSMYKINSNKLGFPKFIRHTFYTMYSLKENLLL